MATAAFSQISTTVTLGNQEFELQEMPLPRIKRFQKLWSVFFEEIQKLQAETAAAMDTEAPVTQLDQWNRIMDLALEQPHAILSVLIPDLPIEPFEDEDNGVTVPQVFDAFDAVLRVNRIEWLKKLTPFFQSMILNIDSTALLTGTQRTDSTVEFSAEPE